MELKEYPISLEKEIYKSLLNYCNKEEISINQFIKSNLEAIGEY